MQQSEANHHHDDEATVEAQFDHGSTKFGVRARRLGTERRGDSQDVANIGDDADHEEGPDLKAAIAEVGGDRAQNLQNDDDEQQVVQRRQ